MANSVPAPFTLSLISVNDTINYKGQQYTITNVVGPTDNGLGVDTYAVTINNAASTVLTCSANNTVINNPGTGAANTGHENWAHTGQAF